jgi:poly(3-hydroxybutyrate) depolymerase
MNLYCLLVAFLATALSASDVPEATTQPAAEDAEFVALVQSYFQEPAKSKRAAIAADIETAEGATLARVADALGQVQLWPDQPAGTQQIDVQTVRPDRQVHVTEVHFRVPSGYDPARAYPLLLALPGENAGGEEYLRFATHLLGERADDYLVAAPEVFDGVWLGSTEEESHDLPRLLAELKRKFHVDSDRVYVSGYSLGGHAAFSIAALYGDWFAASVPLSGTFETQAGW